MANARVQQDPVWRKNSNSSDHESFVSSSSPSGVSTPASECSTLPSLDEALVVVASSRVVIQGRVIPATVVMSAITGKINEVHESILEPSSFPVGTVFTDYSPHIILPGLVDAHVHLNEPGRTEWEGFYTGTQAAAFGGVTTVVDMPLNAIPPTTTVENLERKIEAAAGKCWVDVGFYGGIIPGNTHELRKLVAAGVRGFKCFMCDSGVEEFPCVSSSDLKKALSELRGETTTVMFHAEMFPESDEVDALDEVPVFEHPTSSAPECTDPADYRLFLQSRPPALETCAIREVISLSKIAPELSYHIVHLSAMEAIPLLRDARAQGVQITAETCPHYLSLTAEAIPHGDTRHKCCPPIRSSANQDALWHELLQHRDGGIIKTVVSDHSPCTPDLKLLPPSISPSCQQTPPLAPSLQLLGAHAHSGNFMTAWGGISSVGLGLPILWTEMTRRGLTDGLRTNQAITDVVQWCCANTAIQVGLETTKGTIAPGTDADLCVFDPDAEWVVKPDTMLFRNKCSPYQGRVLRGMVRETWVRGRKVFARNGAGTGTGDDAGGVFLTPEPTGKLLLKPRTAGGK